MSLKGIFAFRCYGAVRVFTIFIGLTCAALLGGCAPAISTVRPTPKDIIYTGTPTEFGWWLVDVQWMATKITVKNPGIFLTDVAGFFKPTASADVIVEITDSDGELPGKAVHYANSFHVDYTKGPDWYGIHGITDLKLPPNDYWVIFRPEKQIDRILEMPKNPPDPVAGYAVNVDMRNDNRQWLRADDLNVGIKISGNPSP